MGARNPFIEGLGITGVDISKIAKSIDQGKLPQGIFTKEQEEELQEYINRLKGPHPDKYR